MAARVEALVQGVGGTALRTSASLPPDPALLAAELVAALERTLQAARRVLGALDAAIGHDAVPVGRTVLCPTAHGLSEREAEVLSLLAAGYSNRRTAHTLCLSPRTVQCHVANTYALDHAPR